MGTESEGELAKCRCTVSYKGCLAQVEPDKGMELRKLRSASILGSKNYKALFLDRLSMLQDARSDFFLGRVSIPKPKPVLNVVWSYLFFPIRVSRNTGLSSSMFAFSR